ncbi:MAG: 30S ribosomal protein S9 [bacterium]|nr:30S ribosomal protein S9 [bacterium]
MAKEQYIEKIGRRKTSSARVRITPATKATFLVNDVDAKEYFKIDSEKKIIMEPLFAFTESGATAKWAVEVHVFGGGTHSQSEAIRHGLAQALVATDLTLRTTMKTAGFLKRDPRAKERRKFGLKKARKAPQWSKR